MNVQPAAPYTSRLGLGTFQSGLVGTVRFTLLDNDAVADDPVFGPTVVSIIEDPTGSGSYLFHGTAPNTTGVYTPAWDLGPGTELFFDENLVVVTSAAPEPVVPSGRDYLTLEQLKSTLEMTGLTFADLDMRSSISAASRMVDYYTNRRFWKDTGSNTRTYMPRWSRVNIDDLIEYDDITAGVGGANYSLTEGSDFSLLPLNAAADGRPFEIVQFLSTSLYRPDFSLPSLAITGTFGWPSIPDNVVAATTILSTRILRRQREAPFGIVTIGIESGAAMRIAAMDPDVKSLLDDFTKEKVLISVA